MDDDGSVESANHCSTFAETGSLLMPVLTTLSRVTLIAESIIESKLVEGCLRLGAKGWSAVNCRGDAELSANRAFLDAGAKSRIEFIIQPAVAEKIIDYLAEDILPNFAVVVTVESVQVLRPQIF